MISSSQGCSDIVAPQSHDYATVWQPYRYMGYIGFIIHDRGHCCQLGGFSSGGFCQVVWSREGVSIVCDLGHAIFLYPTPCLPPSHSLLAAVSWAVLLLLVLC